jgi:hypothetical protein
MPELSDRPTNRGGPQTGCSQAKTCESVPKFQEELEQDYSSKTTVSSRANAVCSKRIHAATGVGVQSFRRIASRCLGRAIKLDEEKG